MTGLPGVLGLLATLALAGPLAGCLGPAGDGPATAAAPAQEARLSVRQGVQCQALPWDAAAGASAAVEPPPRGGRDGTAPALAAHYADAGVRQAGAYLVPDGGGGAVCGSTDGRVFWMVAGAVPSEDGWTPWTGPRWWWKVQEACKDEAWQPGGPVRDGPGPGAHRNETLRMAAALAASGHPVLQAVAYDLDRPAAPCGERGAWRYWIQADGAWPLAAGWLPIPAVPPYPPIRPDGA